MSRRRCRSASPDEDACGFTFGMIKNSQRQKQKRQEEQGQKLKAAKWLAGLIDVVAVAEDGTPRVLEDDEAVAAIIRYWDAEEAG